MSCASDYCAVIVRPQATVVSAAVPRPADGLTGFIGRGGQQEGAVPVARPLPKLALRFWAFGRLIKEHMLTRTRQVQNYS